jgi:hypothetical protein
VVFWSLKEPNPERKRRTAMFKFIEGLPPDVLAIEATGR